MEDDFDMAMFQMSSTRPKTSNHASLQRSPRAKARLKQRDYNNNQHLTLYDEEIRPSRPKTTSAPHTARNRRTFRLPGYDLTPRSNTARALYSKTGRQPSSRATPDLLAATG